MSIKSNYELSRIAGQVLPRKDSDVRPGGQMGLTNEQVQQYIKRQKKAKGFQEVMAAGDANEIDIKLPGDARTMLGFVLTWTSIAAPNTVPSGLVSLVVNNEILIEDVYAEFFGKDYIDEEYYFFPRPLSGKDDIKLRVKGVAYVYTMNSNFYYL